MANLEQLEDQLRQAGKFWAYESRVSGKPLTDDEKIVVARQVVAAGMPWAKGVAEDFAARQYPPGYTDEDGQ